jgi:hypothetical protein
MYLVHQGMSIAQDVTTKIRLMKEVGINNMYQLLLTVWDGLNRDICLDMDESDNRTTTEAFSKKLEVKERIWRGQYVATRGILLQGNVRCN